MRESSGPDRAYADVYPLLFLCPMTRFPLYLLGCTLLLACSQEQPASTASTAIPADSLRNADANKDSARTGLRSGRFRFADSTSLIKWPAPFRPTAARLCPRKARRAVRIYQRPDSKAAEFGQLAAGELVTLAARTADGWVGFDPATAQAANVGIFRLRWVRAADAFDAADSCARLPLVEAPPAGCLLMATRPVEGRIELGPDVFQDFTIPTGSYAQVLQLKPDARGRIQVVVPGRKNPGYVAGADVNLNGPCR
jgi:hypothetical protein